MPDECTFDFRFELHWREELGSGDPCSSCGDAMWLAEFHPFVKFSFSDEEQDLEMPLCSSCVGGPLTNNQN